MKKFKKVNEAEEKPKQESEKEITPSVKLSQMMSMSYPDFIKELTGQEPPTQGEKSAEIDPKVVAVLNAGLRDEQGPTDEKIQVVRKTISVKNLFPTQSQIGLKDSIGYVAFIKPENVLFPLKGAANFGGESILTANGKWILDGHHRWSQTYILNPEATIPCLDLTLSENDEKEILKVVQLAIASTYGAIVMKSANAESDIFNESIITSNNQKYKIAGDTTLGLLKAVLNGDFGITETKTEKGKKENVEIFINKIKDFKKLKDREGVEKYLAANADDLRKTHGKPEGAPARSIMPQPDDTAKATGKKGEKIDGIPKDFVNKFISGELNYKADFKPIKQEVEKSEKTQESRIIKTYEKFISKYKK